MAFERTAAGQANRAIFFGADVVCYVEGDEGTNHGVDIAFWSNVFEALSPHTKIHFSARGGKPVVEALARKVINENIERTIVAMDRDYSSFRVGRYIDDRRVFYTFGYSWENDVLCEEQIAKIAAKLCRLQALTNEQCDDLYEDYSRLHSRVGRVVLADFAALLRGGSVLDRKSPGRYCTTNANGRPEICHERCLQDIRKAKNALAGREKREATGIPRGSRFLWGKAFEHYVRIGLQRTVRDVCGKAVQSEHIRDVAVLCFGHCLATGQNSPALDHYRHSWQRYDS